MLVCVFVGQGEEMTADKALGVTVKYLRLAILVALLASLAIIILKQVGVILPIRAFDHVTLAYLAGCYWLTK